MVNKDSKVDTVVVDVGEEVNLLRLKHIYVLTIKNRTTD